MGELKDVIIAGPSRAGKTTLARRVGAEFNRFVISLDKVAAVFHKAYPRLNIGLNLNRTTTADNLAPFIGHFLGAFAHGGGFVLEGGYFNFDIIAPILKTYGIKDLREHFTLIGLVQNKKTADEFFNDFRKYDNEDDWTYSLTDEDLREVSQDAVSFSRYMTKHLTKHGFKIYDTSKDRERVFDAIMKDIVRVF